MVTPAERAVIDAARAYVAYYWGPDAPTSAAGTALYAAVRALPRPLSEQLAELRVGDRVEIAGGLQREFVMRSPLSGRLFIYEPMKDGVVAVSESMVTRIISNPEESNG